MFSQNRMDRRLTLFHFRSVQCTVDLRQPSWSAIWRIVRPTWWNVTSWSLYYLVKVAPLHIYGATLISDNSNHHMVICCNGQMCQLAIITSIRKLLRYTIRHLNNSIHNTRKWFWFFYLKLSCINLKAIFNKSAVNILNILLLNTGEYQNSRPL